MMIAHAADVISAIVEGGAEEWKVNSSSMVGFRATGTANRPHIVNTVSDCVTVLMAKVS
jgi:hypothetical protein